MLCFPPEKTMKIAIDTSSLSDQRKSAHKVRGIGSYTTQLVSSLKKYTPEHEIVEFSSEREIPKGVDIIHYPYFDPFSLSLPFVKAAKAVVTVHDFIPLLFPDHFPSGLKGSLRWQVQRFLLRKMDGVISVSECTLNDCIRFTHIKPDAIRTVYSAGSDSFAINPTKTRLKEVHEKYNLPDKFVLYVGDATWNKNLPRIIQAAVLRNTPLVMVGKAIAVGFDASHPWNKDLSKIAALTMNSANITKTGYVPEEDLVCLYRLATVLVMPSLYEGFGLPILEAMMSSCPVITSSRGAIPEIAGDAALYVDPESVENIAGGIRRVYEDGKLRKFLIEKGEKQARRFSWKHTAEQTVNIYKEIFNR